MGVHEDLFRDEWEDPVAHLRRLEQGRRAQEARAIVAANSRARDRWRELEAEPEPMATGELLRALALDFGRGLWWIALAAACLVRGCDVRFDGQTGRRYCHRCGLWE